MSIISAGRAAEFGVLARRADALQQASQLDTPVPDKTGTLTEGKPQVVEILDLQSGQRAAGDRLPLRWSKVPTTAGARHHGTRRTNAAAGRAVHSLRGAGVSGEIDGAPVLLATPRCWSSIRLRPLNWKRRCAPKAERGNAGAAGR